jgi:transcriptional repressor NrdR
MRCPYCRVDNDRVSDTRASDDGFAIRRRRRCNACHRRFSTCERIERNMVRVVKRDQSRQPFDAEKVRAGIERACWKRPVPTARIKELVMQLENEIQDNYDEEITSEQVGELVMQALATVDEVAYIRFASVYRSFSKPQDFIAEISPYLQSLKK